MATREERFRTFLEKSKEIHGGKYCYDNSNYINSETKVIITCPDHGDFPQRPNDHVNGAGCPVCKKVSISNKKRKTLSQFIEEARKAHGDRYDYSKVVYITVDDKVEIICPDHGSFTQEAFSHLNGTGCPYCWKSRQTDLLIERNKIGTLKQEDVIERFKKVHNDFYDYSLVEYVSMRDYIKVICPKHGMFEVTAANHMINGCKQCHFDSQLLSQDHYIKKCIEKHGDKYDYVNTEYVGSLKPITISCKIHGDFVLNKATYHIVNGNGCPRCKSKMESDVCSFVKSLGVDVEERTKKVLGDLELDIYSPQHKIAIEFNGLFWHSDEYRSDDYHYNKTIRCEELGIHLIHIYEDDWVSKQEVIKSRLKNLFGKSDISINGRDCKLEIVKDGCVDFFNDNHLFSGVGASHTAVLKYNDEIVAAMSFGKRRINLGAHHEDGSYELLRLSNKMNVNVVGGATRMFVNFIREVQPLQIMSYADRSWTNSFKRSVYDVLGFSRVGFSRPNYFYIIDSKRKNRFNFRKDILVSEGYDVTKTERQIMIDRGISRIYDSGTIKYIWKS